MRLALPLYFALYIGVAFVLRSWLVWWRTGVNPVVIGTADDVSGYIGRLMRLTIGAIGSVVTVYALAPTVYERLGPFVLLERPAAQASGGLLLAASFLWTVLAQRQMGASWRIGVDQSRRADLVARGLFSVSRNPIIWGCARLRSSAVPFAVAAYITAAYWFTASTSFANPAVTLARSATDTFAGIRPADAPAFIGAQLLGTACATVVFRWLAPSLPAVARVSADRQGVGR